MWLLKICLFGFYVTLLGFVFRLRYYTFCREPEWEIDTLQSFYQTRTRIFILTERGLNERHVYELSIFSTPEVSLLRRSAVLVWLESSPFVGAPLETFGLQFVCCAWAHQYSVVSRSVESGGSIVITKTAHDSRNAQIMLREFPDNYSF
jgi:hypothetical protein